MAEGIVIFLFGERWVVKNYILGHFKPQGYISVCAFVTDLSSVVKSPVLVFVSHSSSAGYLA